MPKSKYTNHKGRTRRFTSQDELEEQRKKEERAKQRKGTQPSSSDEEEEKVEGNSSESESESDLEPTKPKGVENLIQVENPNRIQKKTKKLSALNESVKEGGSASKPELSRREREELEKQRATQHYYKLHAEGKTEEARADLARLAIIKQQREEAAKRREKEKQEKEAAKQMKAAQTQKALGKKTA